MTIYNIVSSRAWHYDPLFSKLIKLDSFSNKKSFLQGYGDYYVISAIKKVILKSNLS